MKDAMRTHSMRRRAPGLAALALLAGGIGWIAVQGGLNAASAAAARKGDAPARVQELASSDYAVVDAGPLSVVLPVTGTLMALNQATVRAKVPGEVVASVAEEGVRVAKGQIVMRFDTRDLQARMVAQQAACDNAAARLDLAQRNQLTSRVLVGQRFISQSAFETTENAIATARAALTAAASERDIARRALQDASVRAPFDGVISKRMLQLGEKAAPDTPLFALVALGHLVLEAPVAASMIAKVRVGQNVDFETEGFEGRRFSGKVERINPAAEGGSRMLTVYASVPNSDGALRAGMFAKGAILLDQSAAHPLVPLSALRRDDGADVVYKISGGRIVAQRVQLGMRDEAGGKVAVVSGLAAGERIMLLPLAAIRPGTPVSLPAKG
jgi:membrane fusion protein (multidrug efflux system)